MRRHSMRIMTMMALFNINTCSIVLDLRLTLVDSPSMVM